MRDDDDDDDEDDDDGNQHGFSIRAGWNSITGRHRQSLSAGSSKEFRPLTKTQMQLAELENSTIADPPVRGGASKPSTLELAMSKAQAQRSWNQQSGASYSKRGFAHQQSEVANTSRTGELFAADLDNRIDKFGSRDDDDEEVVSVEKSIAAKKKPTR